MSWVLTKYSYCICQVFCFSGGGQGGVRGPVCFYHSSHPSSWWHSQATKYRLMTHFLVIASLLRMRRVWKETWAWRAWVEGWAYGVPFPWWTWWVAEFGRRAKAARIMKLWYYFRDLWQFVWQEDMEGVNTCIWMWIYTEHMSEAIITDTVIAGWGRDVFCTFCRTQEPCCSKLETTFTPCLEQLEKQISKRFFTPLLQQNAHSEELCLP